MSFEAKMTRPHLKKHTDKIAEKVAASTGAPKEAIGEVIAMLIPLFMPWLEKLLPCFKPDVDPTPVDPTPTPTPATTLAWKNSFVLQKQAQDAYDGSKYSKSVLNHVSKEIKKGKRKNGEKIKNHEADELAIQALDVARTTDRTEIQQTILEAQA